MKKIIFLLFVSVMTYGQGTVNNPKIDADTSSNSFIKGSFLNGRYPKIDFETKVVKEIGSAKIIYKILHKNDIMSAHTNPTDVLVTVILGKVNVNIQRKNNLLEVGDYINIPANAVHELICIEESKILIIK